MSFRKPEPKTPSLQQHMCVHLCFGNPHATCTRTRHNTRNWSYGIVHARWVSRRQATRKRPCQMGVPKTKFVDNIHWWSIGVLMANPFGNVIVSASIWGILCKEMLNRAILRAIVCGVGISVEPNKHPTSQSHIAMSFKICGPKRTFRQVKFSNEKFPNMCVGGIVFVPSCIFCVGAIWTFFLWFHVAMVIVGISFRRTLSKYVVFGSSQTVVASVVCFRPDADSIISVLCWRLCRVI